MRRLKLHLLIFLALSMVVPQSCIHFHPLYPRYHVYLINNLSRDVLRLHCKSKDDDLGEHALSINSHFYFTFKENIWRTTLFWCNFYWGNNHGGGYRIWWDEYYGSGWLTYECDYKKCIWSARDDGLYLLDLSKKHKKFNKRYDWKR